MGKMNLAWSSTMKKKEPSNNNKEADGSSGGDHDAADEQHDHDQLRGRWRRPWLWRRRSRWVFPATPAFMMKWKRLDFHLQLKIIDKLVFRVLYVVEAIVLVSVLCFFYLCCGCHI